MLAGQSPRARALLQYRLNLGWTIALHTVTHSAAESARAAYGAVSVESLLFLELLDP